MRATAGVLGQGQGTSSTLAAVLSFITKRCDLPGSGSNEWRS